MNKKRFQLKESAFRSAPGRSSSRAGAEEADAAVSVADRQRVELWAAELPLMVRDAGRAAEFSPKSARRLLAAWARLARVDPRALPVPEGPDDALLESQRFIRDNGPELAEAAGGAIDSEAWAGTWLSRAENLKAAYEEWDGRGAAEREGAARSLLLDLDDMELVGYACRLFGQPDPSVARAVKACGQWVAENAEAFLSCGQRVRAELALMRRDLPTVDAELSQTVAKFLLVRSAVEEMEHDLAFG